MHYQTHAHACTCVLMLTRTQSAIIVTGVDTKNIFFLLDSSHSLQPIQGRPSLGQRLAYHNTAITYDWNSPRPYRCVYIDEYIYICVC